MQQEHHRLGVGSDTGTDERQAQFHARHAAEQTCSPQAALDGESQCLACPRREPGILATVRRLGAAHYRLLLRHWSDGGGTVALAKARYRTAAPAHVALLTPDAERG